MNGYGERCGNANLVSIVPNLQLKMGHRCLPDESLRGPDRGLALPRRAAQLHARPEPAVRGHERVRAQGRHARGRRRGRPGDVRAHRPGRGRQRARAADLRAVGQGHGPAARAADRRRRSTPEAAARVVERVKELEHRGYHFEAADGTFDLLIRRETGEYEPLFRLESWRVIAEKREDGRVQTEATIKIWVEGERYVKTAEGNGPVNALDTALRAAITETYPHLADIKLVNYKVRILDEAKATGAVTRVLLDASDGDRHVGRDRRLGERDRGQLGGAGRLAGGRLPARARAPPAARRGARGRLVSATTETIPLAQPGARPGGGARGARGAALRPAVARPARAGVRGGVRRARRRAAARARCPPARRRCTSPCGRSGCGTGDEVVTSPFSFVASANAILYEGARPVFADIDPVTLNLDPAAAEAAIGPRTTALLPGPHLRLPGRHAGVRAARPADRRGRLRGARRRARRRPSGRRPRAPGGVRLLRQQAAHDRRGRHAHARRPPSTRSGSTPSATRAARPTWAGSTMTGSASTTACRTSPARSGSSSSSASTACWPTARASPGGIGRRWRG